MVMGMFRRETEVAIIGSGPGGYVAALRAADLGKDVVLIEERERTGGVCLLEGCIPSKTLIHAVEVAESARRAATFGLAFDAPRVDPKKLRAHTQTVVDGLSRGVDGLLARRGVEVISGRARFDGAHSLLVQGKREVSGVDFTHAVIATGSRPKRLAQSADLDLWSSAEALALGEVPKRLVVVGGGYIGLELGLVYAGLGAQVSVVEFFPRLLAGADPDLVAIMARHASERLHEVALESKVVGITRKDEVYRVEIDHRGERRIVEGDRVLVAVGRVPNSADLGLKNIGLQPNAQGRIAVDEKGRTARKHIFAIGDVAPGPMLAHKASREAKVVAEVIAGHQSAFDNRAIPAVVYTDPEIAWAGLTERQAKAQNMRYRVGRFPLRALGRARTLGRSDGLVKVLADSDTNLVLGVGMVGPHASELIAEGTLALEMGATLEDLMVTIHPHPTLSEAVMEAADMAAGMPVHLNPPRNSKQRPKG
jgi:dihydrolipoamide dehydrogenase